MSDDVFQGGILNNHLGKQTEREMVRKKMNSEVVSLVPWKYICVCICIDFIFEIIIPFFSVSVYRFKNPTPYLMERIEDWESTYILGTGMGDGGIWLHCKRYHS